MKRRIGKGLRIFIELLLLCGLVFLFLRTLDIEQLRANVFLITPGVVVGVIGFQLAILGLATACWAVILREAGIYRGPRRAFLARLSGFSITYLTPSISFGGVPARAALYKDNGMRGETLYATIAVDTVIEVAGKIPCIAVGFFFLVLRARPGVITAVAAGFVVLLSTGILALLTAKMLSGKSGILRFAGWARDALGRVNAGLAARLFSALRLFAEDIEAIAHGRKALLQAILMAVGIGLIEVLQTLFILHALGAAGIGSSFIIFSSVLFQAIFGILPGNLGGMEGTHAFVFGLLGMGPALGLIYTIILRIGQMVMALLGILNILRWRLLKAAASGSRARSKPASDSSRGGPETSRPALPILP
jgi:uncharacterized protein (TIRG00374 family)